MKRIFCIILCLSIFKIGKAQVLDVSNYKEYIDTFNAQDNELYKLGEFPNDKAWDFLSQNIPILDCPDKQLEKTYYFRWWTYRKHVRKTAVGYIITEFLPDVSWAGRYNSIPCPGSHHFMEGRWLKNSNYLTDYARFWMKEGSNPRNYSFGVADAVLQFHSVHPNKKLLIELFPLLEQNYEGWIAERQDSTKLFWQVDGRDGMEVSISGSYNPDAKGYRATINSYMYGEALALSKIAKILGNNTKSGYYAEQATQIKERINSKLWDSNAEFYKVIPCGRDSFSDARELHGYTPWYFNIPQSDKSVAWKFIMDTNHFYAPYGLTSAEQCHPLFKVSYEGHECQWNGPVWPFATSITLTAMANLLVNYNQEYVTKRDYFDLLLQYSKMHTIQLEDDGKSQPWIDEVMNPYTGDWISRTRLKTYNNGTWSKRKGGEERGKDYNHSTFNDLIISGLIGVKATDSSTIIIDPLLPDGVWEYFCLDNLSYHDKVITVVYDKYGTKYSKGKGLMLFVDGKLMAQKDELSKICVKLF